MKQLTLILLLFLIGCHPKSDNQLAIEDFEPKDFLTRNFSNEVTNLRSFNEYGELSGNRSSGYQVEIDYSNRYKILKEVKQKIPQEFSAICFYEPNNKVSIAILESETDLNFIKIRGTNGLNYDITNSDIINFLKELKSDYNFEVIGCDIDYIDIRFETPPRLTEKFKKRIVDFCPDVADWLNEEEYVFLMEDGNDILNLWWD